MVSLVLVPQGAEFQAVQRGLRRAPCDQLHLVAIPIGGPPVTRFLMQFWAARDRDYHAVMVMGLCGSLDLELSVGDAVVYQSCQALAQPGDQSGDQSGGHQPIWPCQVSLMANIKLVAGLTTDRVIWRATEKQALQRSTDCQVVDMEGTAIRQFFQPFDLPVIMLRVVSDDLAGDLPDLTGTIDRDGNLQPLPLALKLFQQPQAAWRLIRGSMRGLNRLTALATNLGRGDVFG